jgi:hypothetical protein
MGSGEQSARPGTFDLKKFHGELALNLLTYWLAFATSRVRGLKENGSNKNILKTL